MKQTIIGSTRISNLKKTPWTGLFCKYFTNLQKKKNSYCKKFFLQNVEEVVLLCKKTTTIFSKQKMYNSKSFQKRRTFPYQGILWFCSYLYQYLDQCMFFHHGLVQGYYIFEIAVSSLLRMFWNILRTLTIRNTHHQL